MNTAIKREIAADINTKIRNRDNLGTNGKWNQISSLLYHWGDEGKAEYLYKRTLLRFTLKPPRLTKQRFIAGGAAAIPVAGGLLLGIHLRFHNHTPQQLAIRSALHQQTADELGGNNLGRAREGGWGDLLGERGGYGSGWEKDSST